MLFTETVVLELQVAAYSLEVEVELVESISLSQENAFEVLRFRGAVIIDIASQMWSQKSAGSFKTV